MAERCKRKRKQRFKPEAEAATEAKAEATENLPSLRANPKIRCRSSPNRVIDLVKAKLDIHNLERFQKSCFGPYLKVQKLVFQGPIAHFLLQRLNNASRDEGVLRFKFDGGEACFGPKEYLSITGLRFGASQELPSRSSLREITFRTTHKIYMRDIEKKFKEICSEDGGSGPVALKLAMCLFLFGAVLGPGYCDHPIDMNYFHIFDDVDSVNSFPWGRVSYNFMVSEFYDSKDRMQSQLDDKQMVSVDVNGFGLALQIWVCEVFPDIANLRSYMIDESKLAFPRILRWLSPHKPRYALFEDLFVSSVPMRNVTFTFTQQEVHEIEEALPYNVDFQRDGTEGTPQVIEQVIARPAKRKLHFKLQNEDVMPPAEGISNLLPEGDELMSCLLHDLNMIIPSSSTEFSYSEHTPSLELLTYPVGVQSNIHSIATPSSKYDTLPRFTTSPKVVPLTSDKAISQSTTSVNKTIDLNDLAFPELQFLRESSVNVGAQLNSDPFFEKANYKCIGSPPNFNSRWIDETYPVVNELKALSPLELSYSTESAPSSCNSGFISWDRGDRGESRRRFLKTLDSNAISECSYNMVATSEFHSTPTHTEIHSPLQIYKYSPMKKYSRKLVNRFLIWYRAAKKGHPDADKKLELRAFSIPLKAHSTITLDLIRKIYIPNEQLQDEHCDLLLNLLMYKARDAPGMFNTMWTCVESLFWCKSIYSSYEHASKLMMRYVIGELPLEGALPWCDAVEVFGIAHVLGEHWVAYNIDLFAENITVYDSLSRFNKWPTVKAHFLPLSKFVPRLLKQARELYPTRFREISLDEWPVIEPTDLPQEQTGFNDCGILAVKYLECLTSGYPVGLINPNYCLNFRRYFCAQLYDAGHADEGEFEIC